MVHVRHSVAPISDGGAAVATLHESRTVAEALQGLTRHCARAWSCRQELWLPEISCLVVVHGLLRKEVEFGQPASTPTGSMMPAVAWHAHGMPDAFDPRPPQELHAFYDRFSARFRAPGVRLAGFRLRWIAYRSEELDQDVERGVLDAKQECQHSDMRSLSTITSRCALHMPLPSATEMRGAPAWPKNKATPCRPVAVQEET
jgi:hypothetical protein